MMTCITHTRAYIKRQMLGMRFMCAPFLVERESHRNQLFQVERIVLLSNGQNDFTKKTGPHSCHFKPTLILLFYEQNEKNFNEEILLDI